MGSIRQALRLAARRLARRPGIAFAIVLTLGPGLGGAIMVCDLVNRYTIWSMKSLAEEMQTRTARSPLCPT